MTLMNITMLSVLSLVLVTLVAEVVVRRLLLQDLGAFYATIEKKQYVSDTTMYTLHGLFHWDEEFRTYCRPMPRPGYEDNALYRKARIIRDKSFFMNHAEGDCVRVDVKIIRVAGVVVYVELSPA